MSQYGTATYKNETYEITCEAWVDNKTTNGDIVYYAYAKKDGKKYRVMWYLTKEYKKAQELFNLEERLKQLPLNDNYMTKSEINEIKEIQKEIEELEKEGISSFYCEDGSNACDWDNADDVEEIDE